MGKAIYRPLTVDLLKEYMSYDPKTGEFTRLKCYKQDMVGKPASVERGKGYKQIGFAGHCQLAHKMAWLYMYGEMPIGQIDHIDGNPSNNKISNLRIVTNAQNCQNRHVPTKLNKSKLLGVIKIKNRFVAQIKKNYKSIHLGTFKTAEEAHIAYLAAKREMHPFGEVAK